MTTEGSRTPDGVVHVLIGGSRHNKVRACDLRAPDWTLIQWVDSATIEHGVEVTCMGCLAVEARPTEW